MTKKSRGDETSVLLLKPITLLAIPNPNTQHVLIYYIGIPCALPLLLLLLVHVNDDNVFETSRLVSYFFPVVGRSRPTYIP
jgi:hypothetical protein